MQHSVKIRLFKKKQGFINFLIVNMYLILSLNTSMAHQSWNHQCIPEIYE